jgi:fucose permease
MKQKASLVLMEQLVMILVVSLAAVLCLRIFAWSDRASREMQQQAEAVILCQNAAETSVTGWMVTYYKSQEILSGTLSTYTVTIMWGATLIARLLIAFVFPIKDTFKSLAMMGLGCTVLYGAMMFSGTPAAAIVMLFAFAFSMAGVNPVAVAGTGRQMSAASMGILLPTASIGAIIMPWLIGLVADGVSLQAGMALNLVPCLGIMILSLIVRRIDRKKA